MHTRALLIVLIIVFSTGCAAIKNNVVVQEPDTGPRARVRVSVPDVSYRGVRAYPKSACTSKSIPGNGMIVSVQMPLGFEKNLNGKRVGIPDGPSYPNGNSVSAEVYVSAGQPIAFSFLKPSSQIVNGSYVRVLPDGCSLAVSFVPDADKDYSLVFGEADRCDVIATQLVSSGERLTEEPVLLRPAFECKARDFSQQ